MSPRWLMLYPGAFLIAVGVTAQVAIARGPIFFGGVGFDIHTMLYAGGAVIIGIQLILFSLLARTIGVLKNVLPMSQPLAHFLRAFTLERGILLGVFLGVSGFGLATYSIMSWAQVRLAALDPAVVMRVAIPSVTLMVAGVEIIFSSFLLRLIDVRAPGAGNHEPP
jgi:hypothetical protein